MTFLGRHLDRAQRALERRAVSWYARRVAGDSPERRFELLERLAGFVYPDHWFSEFGRTWLDDEDFVRWYEREEPNNRRSADRKFTLRELTKLVLDVPGAVAECGVYRGASAELMGRSLPGRELHLFDSFEGLSPPETSDGGFWRAGDLRVGPEPVARRLTSAGIPHVIHAGWIPERFHEVADLRFAFVHIDVDLRQPTMDSLEFFYPRLSPGAVVVFDDYGFRTCPGARSAVDEYMATASKPVLHLPTGQGLFVKR